MSNTFSLFSIFQQSLELTDVSNLEIEIQHLLEEGSVNLEVFLEQLPSWDVCVSEEKILQNGKNLLLVALSYYLTHAKVEKDLAFSVRTFARESWNESSKYHQLLLALHYFLVGLPVPDVYPQLLEGGSSPLDLQDYCPWQALPYQPYHAEYGTLLCLLGLLSKKEELGLIVERLVSWQLNTLNYQFLPLPSLFVQEKNGSFSQNLMWTYLLFNGAARLTGERKFQTVAEAQLRELERLNKQQKLTVEPLLILVEFIFNKHPPLEKELFYLSEHIFDPSTALIGRRFDSHHAICTLHGGHTGLGTFKFKDVEIVNYGPQYLPLGDCLGFGIEGNHLSDHGLRESHLQFKPQGFSLKGCVRLVDYPPVSGSSLFSLGDFRGIWLDTEQELIDQRLKIQTTFLGFDGWESVAFSFFVKAEQCLINSTTSLLPRTFNRYEGHIHPIILKGQNTTLKIYANPVGTMQVIPLGGGDNFWGADFLIAYLLDSKKASYHWHISPSN